MIKELNGFEIDNPSAIIWRYMTIEYFISLLEKRVLYFPSINQVNDEFEGSLSDHEFKKYYNNIEIPQKDLEVLKKYHRHTILHRVNDLTQMVKISCWCIKKDESFLMWKAYTDDQNGTAIKSSVQRLKSSLKEYKIQPSYEAEQIWVGKVKYTDYKTEQNISSDLSRFFYKRKMFSEEHELRLAISLTGASEFVQIPKEGVSVPIDVNRLIKEIYCISQKQKELVRKIIDQQKLNLKIKVSDIKEHASY